MTGSGNEKSKLQNEKVGEGDAKRECGPDSQPETRDPEPDYDYEHEARGDTRREAREEHEKEGWGVATILSELQERLNVPSEGHEGLRGWFEEDLGRTFEHQNVAATPLLLLLAEDVLTHAMLVANLHKQLNNAAAENVKEAAFFLDTVLKAREKLRKSIGDLQAACAAAGTPVSTGLSSLYGALGPKVAGIVEAAVAYREAHPVSVPVQEGLPLECARMDTQAVVTSVSGGSEEEGKESEHEAREDTRCEEAGE